MLGNLIGGFKMAGALVPASLKLPLLVGASIVAAPIGYIFSGTVLSVGKIAAVACAPFLNQNVAENAIANNNAGLLEFSSALDSILTKIPYIGDKFKLNSESCTTR